MFRKIVTELAYSPALAERLGEYIKVVRHEKARREIGLIFIALAFFVQLFIVTFPPEASNADNTAALTENSIPSITNYISAYYAQNTEGTKDLLSSFGISRADVRAARLASITPSPQILMWSTKNSGNGSDTAYSFFDTSSLKESTVYGWPITTVGNNDVPKNELQAYVGSSYTTGWFAVLKNSGNLLTRSSISQNCQITSTVGCNDTIQTALSAYNITLKSSASAHQAKASDRILYTLSIKNTGTTTTSIPLTIEVGDILEYAQILDNGGGTLNKQSNILTWQPITIPAGKETARTFIVQLLPTIPSYARGVYTTNSYDCNLSANFGNRVTTSVSCPFPKKVESIIATFPHISAIVEFSFMTIILGVALYLYARSRQFLAELHSIQHNHSGGL